MVYGKYASGTAGSKTGVTVGKTGVDVEGGASTVVVGASWNGVGVGSTPDTNWLCDVQATTVKRKQEMSSFFPSIDSTILSTSRKTKEYPQHPTSRFIKKMHQDVGIFFMEHADAGHRIGWYTG